MEQIDCQIEEIIEYEGGYVNDPDDPGGPTNFGITQSTLAKWRASPVTPRDVQDLTRSEVLSIYKKMYYHDTLVCDLHPEIQTPVLDMYIHSGATAIRLFQGTLRKAGYILMKDGRIGPETIRVSETACREMGTFLTDAYGIERIEYYYRLGDSREQFRKYITTRSGRKGGWIQRAERFMNDEFHVRKGDHAKRTESWG